MYSILYIVLMQMMGLLANQLLDCSLFTQSTIPSNPTAARENPTAKPMMVSHLVSTTYQMQLYYLVHEEVTKPHKMSLWL